MHKKTVADVATRVAGWQRYYGNPNILDEMNKGVADMPAGNSAR
ncbi:hypothetical protein V9K92_05195 [Phyllobacterium sp. CCNWLW109]